MFLRLIMLFSCAVVVRSQSGTGTATATGTASRTGTGSRTGTSTGTPSSTAASTSSSTPSTTYTSTRSWRPLTRTQTALGTPSGSATPSSASQVFQVVRYVRITQTQATFVNFAEFMLFNNIGVNIALNKPSNLTNTMEGIYYLGWDFTAARCNDGSVTNFCTTASSNVGDWWEVDLGPGVGYSSLAYIDLWARSELDCCSDRSAALAISFLDETRVTKLSITTTTYGFPYTINLVPLFASITPLSPSGTLTASPTPACFASLYRSLPRTDLVGTLMGNAWYPGTSLPTSSESACRQACCDAPVCNAYTFASNDLQLLLSQSSTNPVASCFLYTNVTALVPSSVVTSGALLSAYS